MRKDNTNSRQRRLAPRREGVIFPQVPGECISAVWPRKEVASSRKLGRSTFKLSCLTLGGSCGHGERVSAQSPRTLALASSWRAHLLLKIVTERRRNHGINRFLHPNKGI